MLIQQLSDPSCSKMLTSSILHHQRETVVTQVYFVIIYQMNSNYSGKMPVTAGSRIQLILI